MDLHSIDISIVSHDDVRHGLNMGNQSTYIISRHSKQSRMKTHPNVLDSYRTEHKDSSNSLNRYHSHRSSCTSRFSTFDSFLQKGYREKFCSKTNLRKLTSNEISKWTIKKQFEEWGVRIKLNSQNKCKQIILANRKKRKNGENSAECSEGEVNYQWKFNLARFRHRFEFDLLLLQLVFVTVVIYSLFVLSVCLSDGSYFWEWFGELQKRLCLLYQQERNLCDSSMLPEKMMHNMSSIYDQ